jgi:hypothetical protein
MSKHEHQGSPASNGDTALKRTWREASDELPPAHVDAAIIAASRKAVADRGEPKNTVTGRAPARAWLTRWQPLAAAATVAGLAFVLVQMLPREVPNDRPAASGNRTAGPAEREVVAGPVPAQGVGLASPSAPLVPPSVSAEADADRRQAVTLEQPGQVASAPAAALPQVRASEHAKAAAPDAEAWIARIVALHAAGELAAAADALRAFRAADADADTYLPDSLRDWAAAVP